MGESEQEHREPRCAVHGASAAGSARGSVEQGEQSSRRSSFVAALGRACCATLCVCHSSSTPRSVAAYSDISHLRAWVHPNVTTGRVGSTQAARKEKQNSDQHRTTVKSHMRTEAQLITSTELTTNNQAVKTPVQRYT